jgi:flagellar biosynthetic protein FliQ
MSPLLDLWRGALVVVFMVGGPFLLTALAIGLLISLLQAATQLQENVLSFVPKILGVALVLLLSGSWLLSQLTRYVEQSAAAIVEVGRQRGE